MFFHISSVIWACHAREFSLAMAARSVFTSFARGHRALENERERSEPRGVKGKGEDYNLPSPLLILSSANMPHLHRYFRGESRKPYCNPFIIYPDAPGVLLRFHGRRSVDCEQEQSCLISASAETQKIWHQGRSRRKLNGQLTLYLPLRNQC